MKSLKLDGIHVILEPARSYPGGNDAAQVLGFVGMDQRGLEGIERHLDDYLAPPSDGGSISSRDGKGREMILQPQDAQIRSKSVTLTIDRIIQSATESALKHWVHQADARRGFAVVSDPFSGEVLALANYPGFDPNSLTNASPENIRNDATLALYEPGSVVKSLVIAEAIEKRLVYPNQLHNCEKSGRFSVGERSFIHDDHPMEIAKTSDVIVHSSNICTFKIAKLLGRAGLKKTYDKFGIGKPLARLGLPSTTGRISNAKTWSPIQYANISFGQGLSVSGLEIIRAYNAIANGGRMIDLTLIKNHEITGHHVHTSTILSPATARTMRGILEKVVTHGTGTQASMDQFSSGGKTGTSEKFSRTLRRYDPEKRIASFIGMTPALDPSLTIYVVIDEPRNKPYYGGKWAAPAFREIATKSLQYLNIAPEGEIKNPLKSPSPKRLSRTHDPDAQL